MSAVLWQLVSGQIAALPIDAIEALLGSLGNKPEAMVAARVEFDVTWVRGVP